MIRKVGGENDRHTELMTSEHCKLMTSKLQITAPTHYRIKLIHSSSLFYWDNLLLHSSNKRRHNQTTPAHWTLAHDLREILHGKQTRSILASLSVVKLTTASIAVKAAPHDRQRHRHFRPKITPK